MPALTPSQTIGPFFHEGLKWAVELSGDRPDEGAARVTGRMLDVDAKGVSDGLVEVWLPGWAASRSSLPGLQRVVTDAQGRFGFYLPDPTGGAVYAHVTVFARGLLCGLFTRVYLSPADDAAAVPLPPGVPAERRATLVAKRTHSGAGAPGAPAGSTFEWNIRLRGDGETVFFRI